MEIVLENIGRRFNRDWIFKNISQTFKPGEAYAILGANGSGKSTLLQIITGILTPSTGSISYYDSGAPIDIENVFNKFSLATPYMELIEEFSLEEHIHFHFRFKPYLEGFNASSVLALLGLEKSKDKLIKNFSSGMKQRTKLALAFCSDTSALLLDEPTANLDTNGVDWYLNLIQKFAENRLLIVCSNQEHEYSFCQNRLNVMDYKS